MRTVTEVLRLQHRQNDLKWMNLVPAGSPTMLSNHQTNVHVLQAKLERMLLTYGASLKYPPSPVNVWRLALGLATGNRAHYFIVSSKAQMLRKGVYIHTYIHRERERERCIVVQLLSHVWLFATPWTAVHQAYLSNTNSQSLLKLMSIESLMPSNHLIFCHPLLLLTSIFPSIRVFSNESVLRIWWPKY